MEWILAAILGGALTFNAVVTPDAAAKTARKALQKQFPGAKVNVEIDGRRGNDVLNGRFKRIRLDMDGATFEKLPFSAEPPSDSIGATDSLAVHVKNAQWEGFPVEKIDFEFRNLRYDWKALREKSEFRLVSTEKATLKVRLGATALLPLVQSRIQEGQNVRVQMRGGQFIVTGSRAVLGFVAPFELRAKPTWSGKQVGLGDETLSVSGVSVPNAVAKPFLGDLSNFYTFDKTSSWPLNVNVTDVRAEDDALQISADLTLKTKR